MRHFSSFLFFLFCSLGFAQSVTLFEPATGQVYPAQMYFCASETFNLKVDATASSTGDYGITGESPGSFPLSAGGTDISFPASGANKFSTSFPIGFTFSFYGKNYTKVVAGSNGRLVFTNDSALDNLNDVNTYTDKTFSGIAGYNSYSQLPSTDYNKVFKNNPTQELPLAQIFFGYTDLVPKSVKSSVSYTYKNVMVGTQNALLVSYQNQIRSDGTGGFSGVAYSSNILLIADGRIVIYVNNKIEDNYNAILGIQNDDASKFKVPDHSSPLTSNYNNGHWQSEGKAWLFTPNQNLTPQFEWFRNGALLPETSDTFSGFAPNDNDILKVEVSYMEEPTNIKTDQVTFKKIAKPVITASSTGGCVTGVTLSVPIDPELKFEWFRVGNPTALGTGNSYYANVSGDYFVGATRITAPLCYEESAPVNVNLNSTIPAFNESNTPLYYCENSGAATKTIDLYNYYPADPPRYSLVFTENGSVIPNPGSFVINANTSRTVHIDVTDNNPMSGCTINRDFDIRYDSLPAAVNLPKRFCFGETSVDVSQYSQDLAGTNFALFDYEYSTNGTSYSTNSVINPKTFPKVWVKISPKNPPAGRCSTVSTILFTEDSKVIANTPTTQLPPQCASATQTFDLASLIPEINADPNVTVTFHETPENAVSGNGVVSYLYRSGRGSTTLHIRVVDNATGCVSPDHPTITLLVYDKPVLKTNNLTIKNCQGYTVFNLTQNPSDLTNAQLPVTVTLEYYAPNGTLLTGNQITNYDEALLGANPYIKVIYNTTCSDVVTFNLSYNPKPVAIVTQIPICSETTYSLQDFKNKVINNPSQYTFTAEDGGALPPGFDVSVLPKPIKFFLKDNITGCISELQTVTFVQNENSALDATETNYELCDTDFDGKTEFNLDLKKEDFTNASATFEYFKDAGFTPSQSIPAKYTNETPFAQTVYVRITIQGFCPSSAEIHLVANIPTKSSTLEEKYFICYGETLTIDAGEENDDIVWSDGQIGQFASFTEAGNYSVTLKNGLAGCPYTHAFTISDENQPKIQVINQTNNSIEVIAEGGAQPYWYYFNGVKQRSPILQNPTDASYEIQVQSETGCFGPPKTVYFIKINNAFSPNGDGINDVWFIDNLDKMEQVSIIIVDRYGTKVFESTKPSETRWDGKQQGRALPTSTYWYAVSWYDAVTQKNEQRQGWILLKNRN